MFRMSPISLYICGKANIGKSYFLIKLTKEISRYLYPKVKDPVFARTTTTEHWDGYLKQPIVILDDHYKMHDGEQKLDAQTTMQVVSCTNFFPPFARMEFKGIPFNSEIVIMTSNIGWPNTIYLNEALHRRHKHHLIIIPNGLPMDDQFNHLDFWYAKGLVDPWNGNYSCGFTIHKDIPYSIAEMAAFPFRDKYERISFDKLVSIIIEDVTREKDLFNRLKNS